MEQKINDFWRDFNSAMNNPAPEDDGGTTSEEVSDLLDRAADLLDVVWIEYQNLLAEQTK